MVARSSSGEWWRPQVQSRSAYTEARSPAALSLPPTGESKLPFRAVMMFTFILLAAPQQMFPVLAPLRIALLSVAVALLAHCWVQISNRRPLIDLNVGIVLVLAILGWCILTVPFSIWRGGSVGFLMERYLKTILAFLLLANIVITLPRLHKLSWALVSMSVMLALTTVKNFASGTMISAGGRVAGYDSPLTENPNDMAMLLNLMLPFAVALLLTTPRKLARIFLVAAIGIMVAAIIATFSRAGFLTLGVMYLIYFWRFRKRAERFLAPVVLLIVIACLPLVPSSYFDRVGTITNIEEDESGSAQERWSDALVASKLILGSPLIGSGVGTATIAMNEARGDLWIEIHNVYLTLGVELGLPGLLLFLMFYRVCLKSTGEAMAWARRSPPGNQQSRELFYLAEAIHISLLAFLVEAFFHPVAYHFYLYYIAGLAIGLRVLIATEKSRLAGTDIEYARAQS